MNAFKTALTLLGIVATSQALLAHSPAPIHPRHFETRVEQRESRQQHRIAQGVRSGELTPRETIHLERQQARVDRHIDRAEADGHVTAREAARIHQQQNVASRRIHRKKHNTRHIQ